MIWKTLAAVAAAIVLVIAINGIGNLVYDANTPTAENRDVRGAPLPETPAVTTADVGKAGQDAPTVTTEPEAQTGDAVPTQEGSAAQTEAQAEAKPDAAPAEATSAEAAPAEATPAEAAPQQAAAPAAGDPKAGQTASRVCAACHTFDAGGPNRVGPNLHGVVGNDIASKDGYSYSAALQAAEGAWTVEALDAYLANPKEAIPGNKMTYAGLRDETKRKDLIAYLQSLE
ncbi:MAG: cytochrome c family protein [Rhodospirillaceae bacterium]